MSAHDPSKKLHALVKRLRAKHPEPAPTVTPAWDGAEPLVAELVFALLLADSSSSVAARAFHGLQSTFVDVNDLRIALSDEIAEQLGEGDAQRHERAARIKAALMDVYQREHATSLASLTDAGKRETRHYLESLSGITPFVVSRLNLLHLSGTGLPVDETLLKRLHAERAVEAGATCQAAGEWIPKQFEPGQAFGHPLALHALFQAWADEESQAPKPAKPDRAASARDGNGPKAAGTGKRSRKAKAS